MPGRPSHRGPATPRSPIAPSAPTAADEPPAPGPSWLGVALTLAAAALAYYVRPPRQSGERHDEENRHAA